MNMSSAAGWKQHSTAYKQLNTIINIYFNHSMASLSQQMTVKKTLTLQL